MERLTAHRVFLGRDALGARLAALILLGAATSLGAACSAPQLGAPEDVGREVNGLKDPAYFAHITDDIDRSRALFVEAGKVLKHPRCVNCHPMGERPLQTDAQQPHQPPVVRGADGHGVVGMKCSTCHAQENVDLGDRSMPGHPAWHLAPASMAWAGRSLGSICDQIKDPERNGNRNLDAIVEHMAEDSLVGWAWTPGTGRSPAPGTQEVFGTLIRAWAAAGAHCPEPPVAAKAVVAP